VKVQLARDPAGFGGRKHRVQRRRRRRIEIVYPPADWLRLGEVDIDPQWHLLSKLLLGVVGNDIDWALSLQGRHEQKQVRGTFAPVLIVVIQGSPGAGGQGAAHFAGQLHRAFVKTDLRIRRITGLGVQIQPILPRPNKVRTHTGNTPGLALPGLEIVF
jgi:hypothetical protein